MTYGAMLPTTGSTVMCNLRQRACSDSGMPRIRNGYLTVRTVRKTKLLSKVSHGHNSAKSLSPTEQSHVRDPQSTVAVYRTGEMVQLSKAASVRYASNVIIQRWAGKLRAHYTSMRSSEYTPSISSPNISRGLHIQEAEHRFHTLNV
jgi:hypothetical protein